MTARAVKHDFAKPRNRLERRNVGKDGHWYLLDGEYAPGVTTILGLGLGLKFDIPSGWAARICADYVIERRDILANEALRDSDVHQLIRNAPRNTTYDAQVKGKTIHAYAEQLHDSDEVELADEHVQWAGQIEQYVTCLDRWGITAVASEIPLAHTTQRWAGTSDLVAVSPTIVELLNEWNRRDGLPELPEDAEGILDVKSGNGIRDKDKCQVVAYSNADLWHIDGVEQPARPIHWAGLIHVQETFAHVHLIRPSYTERLWHTFQNAHEQWQALDEKRGWIQYATDNIDQPTLVMAETAA